MGGIGLARQFSLAHLTVLGCAPPEMTYIAARAGYDFVSFRLIYMGLANEPDYSLDSNRELYRQTRRALADTGLKLHDIELARIYDGLNPRSYLPAMEIAAELGARHVLTSIWTPERNFAVESFAALCDLAKPLGLTVNLEFVTWANVATLREATSILEDAGRDNCGILVDTLHFHRSKVDVAELKALPAQWLHFAHLCDAPKTIPAATEEIIRTGREERLYVGEGEIDIAGILRLMPELPCSIELPHAKRVKELGYAEHAWRCLQTAKAYLAANSIPVDGCASETGFSKKLKNSYPETKRNFNFGF